MVGVFDNQSMLSGFIDPNSPEFAVYNTDRPNYLVDAVDPAGGLTDQGPPVKTNGQVVTRVVSITPASNTGDQTVSLDATLGRTFTLTMPSDGGRTTTVNLSNALPGSDIFLLVSTRGGLASTLVLGTNIYASDVDGTMPLDNTAFVKVYVFHFVCILNPSGVASLYEVTRMGAGANVIHHIGETIV
jgi:hypothetical protein